MTSAAADATSRDSITRVMTSLLCCIWGFTFGATFFECILDACGPLALFAAILPLVSIWAALERKRWARMVLMTLSALAIALFAIMAVWIACSDQGLPGAADRDLQGFLLYALNHFSVTPGSALWILVLSATTLIWLCLPWVREEFASMKDPSLTPGHLLIAGWIVVFWGATMIATPAQDERSGPQGLLRAGRRLTLRY
ncbi:MAG TPA: hypothetical protein VKT77_22855 [Chthonomonadaceae bacterium]|nr:hypothetical protein [Chthonomonadaceae bacterium]